jgi:hypothetical protein
MIRNVLHTFGSFRTALAAAVGIPLVLAGSAYAQNPTPAPVPKRQCRLIPKPPPNASS